MRSRGVGVEHSNTIVVHMRDQRFYKVLQNLWSGLICPFRENTPKREFCAIFAPNFTPEQDFRGKTFGGIEKFEKMTPKHTLIESRKDPFS